MAKMAKEIIEEKKKEKKDLKIINNETNKK